MRLHLLAVTFLLPGVGEALPLAPGAASGAGALGASPGAPPLLVMSAELVVAVAADAASQERWAAQQLALWLSAMPGARQNSSCRVGLCAPKLVEPSAVGVRADNLNQQDPFIGTTSRTPWIFCRF